MLILKFILFRLKVRDPFSQEYKDRQSSVVWNDAERGFVSSPPRRRHRVLLLVAVVVILSSLFHFDASKMLGEKMRRRMRPLLIAAERTGAPRESRREDD